MTLCTFGPPDERKRLWLLRFEDRGMADMYFANEADAQKTFARAAGGWTCTLFVTAAIGDQDQDLTEIVEHVRQYREVWRDNIDRYDAEASQRPNWDGSDCNLQAFDRVMDAALGIREAARIKRLEAAMAWVNQVRPGRNSAGGALVEMTWDEFNSMRTAIGLKPQPLPRRAPADKSRFCRCPSGECEPECAGPGLRDEIVRLDDEVTRHRSLDNRRLDEIARLRAGLSHSEYNRRLGAEREEQLKRERDEWHARAIGMEKRVDPEVEPEA